jgi:hypothetical protein
MTRGRPSKRVLDTATAAERPQRYSLATRQIPVGDAISSGCCSRPRIRVLQAGGDEDVAGRGCTRSRLNGARPLRREAFHD